MPAFALAFAFHEQLIELLMELLADDRTPLVTLGVTEPFTHVGQGQLLRAIAIVLPVLLWQAWAFLAPAVERAHAARDRVFVLIATLLFAAGVLFAYFVILPAALDFLVGYDAELYDEQIRASYFLSFVSLMLLAIGPRLRDADLHPRARAPRRRSRPSRCGATAGSPTC